MNALTNIFGSLAAGVRNVNRKYAKPSIEMTPLVRICLMTLRLYLFVLVGLMIYKFVITARG